MRKPKPAFAVRWANTDGAAGLPALRRPGRLRLPTSNGANRFRCKACRKDFSVTSGTLFASHKMPLRGYLAAIAIFCNEVKARAAGSLPRSGPVLQDGVRVAAQDARSDGRGMKGRVVGGEGKTVEVDGGYFGGYVKPAKSRRPRDRRLANNQTGKRKAVL